MFGIFKRNKTKESSPNNSQKKQPLLVLLENWILHSIGELPLEKQDITKLIVQKAYGGGDNWCETLRKELHLGDDIDKNFQKMWNKNKMIAVSVKFVVT
jgi:hypothetical protein